jgi:hypothetical protein
MVFINAYDHQNCVKIAASQFYLHSGEQKVGWVGDGSHVVFGKKNSLMKD